METQPLESSTKKKIMIDVTFLFDQYSRRGIGRYGRELIKRLASIITKNPNLELHLVGFANLEHNLVNLEISPFAIDELKEKIIFHSLGEPVLSGMRNIQRWGSEYKPLIEFIKPDLYFAVHFERGLPSTPILKKDLSFVPKTVVTCHDVIPFAIPGFRYSSKGFLQNFIKRRFYRTMWEGIRNADLIFTHTDFNKKDIVKYTKTDLEKIQRIYLGIDDSFYRSQSQDELSHILDIYGVKGKKYFFYDSGIEANKGIRELLTVFSKLQNTKEDIPEFLVIVGGDFQRGIGSDIKPKSNAAKEVLKEARRLGVLEKLVTTDKISDEHLINLLWGAFAYINLSRYEGFHFGPVQAMAAEVPAIAANASCTPEVTDGGAFLVDLNNLEKAAKSIKQFLINRDMRSSYIKKGKEIARRYDWDKTAEESWDAMKRLLENS